MIEPKITMGVYSDASFSGIDVCVMTTDGVDIFDTPLSISRSYTPQLREELISLKKDEDFINTEKLLYLEQKITDHILATINELRSLTKKTHPHIDVIGLAGQTVYHNPLQKVNITLANANKIADTLNCPVIDRFIQSDLAAGGKGGPLLATYYQTLTKDLPKPLVFTSLGGITAMTYIGQMGELSSFDVGPGTILLDEWMMRHYGQEMDFDGLMGAKGKVDQRLLSRLMKHPFLHMPPPKSADRNQFNDLLDQVTGSDHADGAATLTAFMASALVAGVQFLPHHPVLWILSGGGSLNPTFVLMIKKLLHGVDVQPASEFGWDKNTIACQGYAFLAARSLFGLPISFPSTTGVSEAITGGRIHYPECKRTK